MKIVFVNVVFSVLICAVTAVLVLLMMMGMRVYNRLDAYPPQHQDINDQFEESNHTELQIEVQTPEPLHTEVETPPDLVQSNAIIKHENDNITKTTDKSPNTTTELSNVIQTVASQPGFLTRLYRIIAERVRRFTTAPKVLAVMSNIGTCLVNGAMEIVSFYFPAPLIPLIASAAGLLIPFEPVVMLREKMPVESYRRAFQKAMTGFLGTFDKYKYEDDDPYMTRRFNRRFMGDANGKENDVATSEDK